MRCTILVKNYFTPDVQNRSKEEFPTNIQLVTDSWAEMRGLNSRLFLLLAHLAGPD